MSIRYNLKGNASSWIYTSIDIASCLSQLIQYNYQVQKLMPQVLCSELCIIQDIHLSEKMI